jgi:hypothetical protein
MHRIDTSGNVDGKFHPGNPATGQQATLVGADWLNAIQEEIVKVILDANIDLEKADNGQLAAAITALIAGVVGDGSGAVPTTRQVLAGGLVTGGGTLAADRTFTVTKATAPEVSAQTRDDVAVTPLGLAGLVSVTSVGSGFVAKIGNGFLQGFTATANGNGSTVVTLPQAYSVGCRAVCSGGELDPATQDNNPFVSGTGLSSVSLFSGIGPNVTVNILAVGI